MSQEENVTEPNKVRKPKKPKLKDHTKDEKAQETADKEDSVASRKPKHYDRKLYRKKGKAKKTAPGPRLKQSPIPGHIRRQVALSYLRQWKEDREVWSFKKKPQYWLLNNFYSKAQVLYYRYWYIIFYLHVHNILRMAAMLLHYIIR